MGRRSFSFRVNATGPPSNSIARERGFMTPDFRTNCYLGKELIVPRLPGTIELMVTKLETTQEHADFARRLNDALDRIDFPAKGKGRQLALAKALGVTQKGARKWLEGEGMPEISRISLLAKFANVPFEWLATGRGPTTITAAPVSAAHAALLSRFDLLSDTNKKLVEIALANPDDPLPDGLPASIQLMLQTIRAAIEEHEKKNGQ